MKKKKQGYVVKLRAKWVVSFSDQCWWDLQFSMFFFAFFGAKDMISSSVHCFMHCLLSVFFKVLQTVVAPLGAYYLRSG